MNWQAKWVKSLDGFAEATRVLEFGAGSYSTAIEIAKGSPEKEIFAVDFELSRKALESFQNVPPNLFPMRLDLRSLSVLRSEFFDFAYSIAVMEHVRELTEHLREAHRVLSIGGSYWFWEVPFWSSSMGHHYFHTSPSCPVPHYAHLYMTRSELEATVGSFGGNAEEAGVRIYERSDLSRLSRTETRRICEESELEMCLWKDDLDQHYSAHAVAPILHNNLYNIPLSDLQYKGAKVWLKRST